MIRQDRRKIGLALASIALFTVAAASVVYLLGGKPVGYEGQAPQRVNIWAVTVRGVNELIAVGGTEDARGNLVVARSGDAGATWTILTSPVPAMTRVAFAGDRLIGSITCLPRSSGGEPLEPGPTSCLYSSDDGGATWNDAGAGRLVDPTFPDSSYGWAHAQAPTGSTLYESADGGTTWAEFTEPCPTSTPLIRSAVATGSRAGYVMCFGEARPIGQPWALIEVDGASVAIKYEGKISGAEPRHGLLDDAIQGFTMRADGIGLIWTTESLYQTTDRGSTWTEVPVSGLAPGSFWGGGAMVDQNLTYLVRRGNATAVVARQGTAWRTLISWPIFGGAPSLY